MIQPGSFLAFALGASIVGSAACARDEEPLDTRVANEEELVAGSYRSLHLSCVNDAGNDPADKVVKTVGVRPVSGTTEIEIARWELFPGMSRPVEAFSRHAVSSITKTAAFDVRAEDAALVVTRTKSGALVGELTYEGKKTTLTCVPHTIHCATPATQKHDHPIRRLVIRHTGKVVNLAEAITGVSGTELTVRVATPSTPTMLLDSTTSLDEDVNGILLAERAHLEDPRTGVVDVVWDAVAKRSVATFTPSEQFGKSFIVPPKGFATAECDLAERSTEALSGE